MFISFNDEQSSKTLSSIYLIPFGKFISSRDSHHLKAPYEIEHPSSGNSIFFNILQFLNASTPIISTISGTTISSNASQPIKACPHIAVTLSGIITSFNEAQFISKYSAILSKSFGRIIFLRVTQSANALS